LLKLSPHCPFFTLGDTFFWEPPYLFGGWKLHLGLQFHLTSGATNIIHSCDEKSQLLELHKAHLVSPFSRGTGISKWRERQGPAGGTHAGGHGSTLSKDGVRRLVTSPKIGTSTTKFWKW